MRLNSPCLPVAEFPTLLVYSRAGCHLCELLIDELAPLIRDTASIEVRDVDSCEDWRSSYGLRVPVVEFAGQFVCQYTLDRAALNTALKSVTAGDKRI